METRKALLSRVYCTHENYFSIKASFVYLRGIEPSLSNSTFSIEIVFCGDEEMKREQMSSGNSWLLKL